MVEGDVKKIFFEKAPFIVFEGVDGSGKSFLIREVAKKLKEKGIKFATTKEPGGSQFGKKYTKLLKDITLHYKKKNEKNNNELSEYLLFMSERMIHVNDYIIPKINRGIMVICDRFTDSSYVYQILLGEIEENLHKIMLKKIAEKNLFPSCIVYCTAPIEIILERLISRGEIDQFDCDGIERIKKIHLEYEKFYKREDKDRAPVIFINTKDIIENNIDIIVKKIEFLSMQNK